MVCIDACRRQSLTSNGRNMQMNLDGLEKQWEDGDDLEELMTEQQAKFEGLEKRRKVAEASAGTFDPRQALSLIHI